MTQPPMTVRDLARTMAVPQMLRLVLALLEENEPFEDAELRLCHGLTTTVATWFGAKVAALSQTERDVCPSCGSSDPRVRAGYGLCIHAWHVSRDQGGDP